MCANVEWNSIGSIIRDRESRVLSYDAITSIMVSLALDDTAIDRLNVSPGLFNLRLVRSLAEC